MNLKIKLFPSGKVPEYKTEGAACADCFYNIVAESITIPPRSSLAVLRNGLVIHGEIDSDYRGELMANVYNLYAKNNLTIRKNERICQIKLVPVYRMEFEPVTELSETVRGEGGFGSTGK